MKLGKIVLMTGIVLLVCRFFSGSTGAPEGNISFVALDNAIAKVKEAQSDIILWARENKEKEIVIQGKIKDWIRGGMSFVYIVQDANERIFYVTFPPQVVVSPYADIIPGDVVKVTGIVTGELWKWGDLYPYEQKLLQYPTVQGKEMSELKP